MDSISRDFCFGDHRKKRFGARFRLEPVHPEHHRDKQRHGEQGERQRDGERRGALSGREGLRRVDAERDNGAGRGDRDADDEPDRRPAGRTAREDRLRIERQRRALRPA